MSRLAIGFIVCLFAAGSVCAATIVVPDFAGQAPSWWATYEQHPYQALIGPAGSPGSRLTNLIVLTVN